MVYFLRKCGMTFAVLLSCNALEFQWESAWPTVSDVGWHHAMTPDGDIVVAGTSANKVAVAKFSGTNGTMVWEVLYGNDASGAVASGVAVAADPNSGNIVVTGSTNSDLGDWFSYNGKWESFVLAYAPNGTFLWARQGRKTADDAAKDVTISSDGKIVFAYADELRQDIGKPCQSTFDVYAPDGTLTGPHGVYFQGNTRGLSGNALVWDVDGLSFYVMFDTGTDIWGSPGAGAPGLAVAQFIASTGAFTWVNFRGGSTGDYAHDIALSRTGTDLYCVGEMASGFDGTGPPANTRAGFLFKVDVLGNWAWTVAFGSIERARDVVDTEESVLVLGETGCLYAFSPAGAEMWTKCLADFTGYALVRAGNAPVWSPFFMVGKAGDGSAKLLKYVQTTTTTSTSTATTSTTSTSTQTTSTTSTSTETTITSSTSTSTETTTTSSTGTRTTGTTSTETTFTQTTSTGTTSTETTLTRTSSTSSTASSTSTTTNSSTATSSSSSSTSLTSTSSSSVTLTGTSLTSSTSSSTRTSSTSTSRTGSSTTSTSATVTSTSLTTSSSSSTSASSTMTKSSTSATMTGTGTSATATRTSTSVTATRTSTSATATRASTSALATSTAFLAKRPSTTEKSVPRVHATSTAAPAPSSSLPLATTATATDTKTTTMTMQGRGVKIMLEFSGMDCAKLNGGTMKADFIAAVEQGILESVKDSRIQREHISTKVSCEQGGARRLQQAGKLMAESTINFEAAKVPMASAFEEVAAATVAMKMEVQRRVRAVPGIDAVTMVDEMPTLVADPEASPVMTVPALESKCMHDVCVEMETSQVRRRAALQTFAALAATGWWLL